jgi:hypothetical protein
MSLQRTLTMGSLTLAIALAAIKPVNAYKPPLTRPTSFNSQSSSFTIAQLTAASSPLNVNWRLQYSNSGILYESTLNMRGYYGSMRTRYFDPQLRRTIAVDQTMSLRSSAYGLILLGSNPVYAGTKRRHPTYSPDNFLLQIRPDGTFIIFTCDNASQCSHVDLEVISS